MATKKPKDVRDAVSAPSDIFKSLLGDVEENAAVSSIFSDSNPFKRKQPVTDSSNPHCGHRGNANVEEGERRKPNKEERSNLDDGEEKMKKLKIQDENDGGSNDKGRKKRKRKRDDVERDYEAKKYGEDGGAEEENVAAVVVGGKRKKAEDENILVSKEEEAEGFDDETKLLRTVFVGNLPLKMKKKALIKEFSQFGEIESVRFRSVPIVDTKKPRKAAVMLKKVNEHADSVHAYIVFRTEQSAEASLAHNMAVLGGNHVRVDRACPPRKKLKGEHAPLYDNKRTVFLGNLPFDVKDEEIYHLFLSIKNLESSLEAIRVVRDPHINVGKGIAYVLFKTQEAANLAVRKRNLKLRDRELRLSHVKQDSKPSKRRNPHPADTSAKSPAKKFAVDSRTPDQNSGSKTKGTMSYQGLRATKLSSLKKGHSKLSGSVNMTPKTPERPQGKRPSVAARKAKAKALKEIGASKQEGKKRKPENQTPESFRAKKKAKKFR